MPLKRFHLVDTLSRNGVIWGEERGLYLLCTKKDAYYRVLRVGWTMNPPEKI